MRFVAVIPARYASTRFPGKPLHPIAGKPLVQHVIERCQEVPGLADVVVATDDDRIAATAARHARVVMTRPEHPSGTDRIAEVATSVEADCYVNVQGDEPLIKPDSIAAVMNRLRDSEMSTAVTPLQQPEDLQNPNVVKAIVASNGFALYFSRRPVPYLRDHADSPSAVQLAAFPFKRHLGLYGYRREALFRIVAAPPSPLELAERLEQLRALELGIRIAVAHVEDPGIGVDVPTDVERVEQILRPRTS